MPLTMTNTAGGTIHPTPFLGPINHSVAVRVDVSELSSDEVDAYGFLKPGVILTRNGRMAGSDGVLLEAGGLAIATTAKEKYQIASTADVLIDGRQTTVSAQNEVDFSAAHVIGINAFGIILIQSDAAGTLSSKVPVSPQVYTSAALALAALPSPDAGNAAIGYIEIANNGTLWTGITDDMTDASDVTTAVFTDSALQSLAANAQRGYGANVEAVKVAAGNTAALLDAAVDIDISIATICMIQRYILEDSLGRSLTDAELYNISDSIVITSL